MNSDNTIVGEVQSLAFGGQGIVRHDGMVVFVPFTAPGDQVRVRIVKQKKSFAEGQLVEILSPGPERCQPPCPYFGVCGGCQLQHLTAEEQLRQKRNFVLDALQRIGKLRGWEHLTIVPATHVWAYRRHIRLTLRALAPIGYEAGYVRHDLSGMIPVSQCPIFADPQDPIISILQAFLKQLTPMPGEGAHVSIIRAKPNRYIIAFQFPDRCPPECAERIPQWIQQQRERLAGVTLNGQAYGNCQGEFAVDALTIRFSAAAFVQCHPEQSVNVYREVVRLTENCQVKIVLDLYCGIGVTALLLAQQGCRVTAVEGNPEAVRLANENAQANQIDGVQFLKADVGRVLEGLLTQLSPDLVILNPPRTGLDPTARERLLSKLVKYLIYISCMPATLARDLAAFQERGYQLRECRAFDMFPQTTHVETVVLMEYGAQS
jgi:23S rRNA (uracil1939-C5)-methyltransferase